MAHIQICDLCNTKLKGKYYVCSLFTIDNVQDILNRANERFELCEDCYNVLTTFLACMRSDSDTLMNIIAGYSHDES